MIIGVLVVTIHIPGSNSLKDKRRVVRRVKDRIKNRNVSVCETGGLGTWRVCELAMAMAAVNRTAAERELLGILEWVESIPEAAMTEHWIEYY